MWFLARKWLDAIYNEGGEGPFISNFIFGLSDVPLPQKRLLEQSDFVEASYPGYAIQEQGYSGFTHTDRGLIGNYAFFEIPFPDCGISGPSSGPDIIVASLFIGFNHTAGFKWWVGGWNLANRVGLASGKTLHLNGIKWGVQMPSWYTSLVVS